MFRYGFYWILHFSRRRNPLHTTGDGKTLGLPKKLLSTWEPRWPRPTSCLQPLSSEYSWTTPSPVPTTPCGDRYETKTICPQPTDQETDAVGSNDCIDCCWSSIIYGYAYIVNICTNQAFIVLRVNWSVIRIYHGSFYRYFQNISTVKTCGCQILSDTKSFWQSETLLQLNIHQHSRILQTY